MSTSILVLVFMVLPILSEKVYFIENTSIEKSQSNGRNTNSNNQNTKYDSNQNVNIYQNNQNTNQNVQHRYESESEETRINKIISKGINSLTLSIDNELAISHSRNNYGQEQNIIFSPVSITGALALILLGAGGKTFHEIANLMGLNYGLDISSNSQIVHNQFGRLLNDLDQRSPYYTGPHTSFASGIFVQNNFPIRHQYKQTSTNVYRSEIFNVDFQHDGGRVQNEINRWVSGRTHGKINDIIPTVLPSNTEMIIISALYFKGEWEYHFMAEATRRRPFYPYGVKNGRSVMVNMMVNGGEFMYFNDNQLDCQIIALPYKGNTTNMYIIIPNDSSIDKLRTFENYLTADHIERLISNMRLTEMILVMPKMTLSSTISLKNVLHNLGVKSLFIPQEANLALISEKNKGNSSPTRKQQDSSYQMYNSKGQTPSNQIRQTTPVYKEEKVQDVFQSSIGQQIYQPQTALGYEINIQPSYQPEILPIYPLPVAQVSYNQNSNQNVHQTTTTTTRNYVYQNPITQTSVHNQQSAQQAHRTTTAPTIYQENKPQSILIYPNPILQSTSTSQFNQQRVQTVHQSTPQKHQVQETSTSAPYYQENQQQSGVVNQYSYQEQQGFQQFNYQPTTQSYQPAQKPTAEYPIVFIQDMNRNDNKKCTDSFDNNCSGFDVVQQQQGNTHKKYVTQNNQRGKRSVQKRQNNVISKQQQIETLDQIRQYLNLQNERDYNPGLYADEVLHKVFIDVSETGTEAAAATAVSISRDGGKVTLKINVPFLFFIREENTKLNMFWGTVNVPTPHFN